MVLWYCWILDVSRIPTVFYLLFLDAGIKRYEFPKIGTKSDFNFCFKTLFEPGLATWLIVIGGYPFGWIGSACR
jgi:hypothetical protein